MPKARSTWVSTHVEARLGEGSSPRYTYATLETRYVGALSRTARRAKRATQRLMLAELLGVDPARVRCLPAFWWRVRKTIHTTRGVVDDA